MANIFPKCLIIHCQMFIYVKPYSKMFLNTIGDRILKEGSPEMIMVLSTLFVQAGVTPPVNGIEQICRCPGDTVKYFQIVP